MLEVDLSTLYYASEFDDLQEIYMLGKQAVGIRLRNTNPYDIVLLDEKKLLKDSLRLVHLFLHPDDIKDHQFISIQNLYPISSDEAIIVHNFGSTRIKANNNTIEVIEQKLQTGFAALNGGDLFLPPYYFTWERPDSRKAYYSRFQVFTGNSVDPFLEWDQKINASSVRMDSFWDFKNFLEVPNRDYFLRHFVSSTSNGFLFNEPASNRYTIYRKGEIIRKVLPVSDSFYASWFVFYDRAKDAYFPVLKYEDDYVIFRLDDTLNHLYPLAKTKWKPLAISDLHVYVRKENKDEPRKRYFEHHLIPLYR
jgi:hypothetical protein